MINIDIIRYNLSYLHPKDGRQEIYGEDYDLCKFIMDNLTDDTIILELIKYVNNQPILLYTSLSSAKKSQLMIY